MFVGFLRESGPTWCSELLKTLTTLICRRWCLRWAWLIVPLGVVCGHRSHQACVLGQGSVLQLWRSFRWGELVHNQLYLVQGQEKRQWHSEDDFKESWPWRMCCMCHTFVGAWCQSRFSTSIVFILCLSRTNFYSLRMVFLWVSDMNMEECSKWT